MSKTCIQCIEVLPEKAFTFQKFCSSRCRSRWHRVSSPEKLAKGRAASLRWARSERGKERHKANEQKPESKQTRAAYRKSPKGKEVMAKSKIAYRMKDGVWMARERASQYGLTVEELKNTLAAGCYAPGCNKKDKLHIDHDHSCCDRQGSCGFCVRGALCASHNLYLGHLERQPEFAKWVLDGSLPLVRTGGKNE